MAVEGVKAFDVGEDAMLLSAKCLWKIFTVEHGHIIVDSSFERSYVVLFVFLKFSNNVEKLR